jgi:predicted RNA-binding protein YlqC (UPF0109 family)
MNEKSSESIEPLPLQELLQEVCIGLVDNPDDVEVTENGADTPTSLLTIKTDPSDVSKILGKQGSTLKTLRELFSKIASARGRRMVIEIIDPRKAK